MKMQTQEQARREAKGSVLLSNASRPLTHYTSAHIQMQTQGQALKFNTTL
jgi:hypothetical protein